jgi:Domain of unknown function (DUF1924)
MKYFLLFPLLLIAGVSQASEAVVQSKIAEYEQQGAKDPDAARGMAKWNEQHMQSKEGKMVSCASCHGTDLTRAGSHLRTGKRIEPMAPSVNPDRLSDPAKIEKWFGRNCAWTLGHDCTAQEKADFLAFIQSK